MITHDFACVGGGEGSFVCQFACRVFAIVSVSAVCACAWSRGWSFACCVYAIFGIFGIFGIFAHACLHVCSEMIGRVFEYL